VREDHALGIARAARRVLDERDGAGVAGGRDVGDRRRRQLLGGHDRLERRHLAPHEPSDPRRLGERDQHPCLRVPQDADLAARVFLEVTGTEGRVDRHGHRPREEHADERAEERGLGAEHDRDAVARPHATRPERRRDGARPLRERAVGDRFLVAGIAAQDDVHPVRRRGRVPREDLGQRAGLGGQAFAGPRQRDGRRLGLDRGRAGARHGRHQIAAPVRLGEHGVAQVHGEGLLEPQRELHALETAQAEIAVEEVVQRRAAPRRQGPQLGGEGGHDLEHAALDVAGGDPGTGRRRRGGRSGRIRNRRADLPSGHRRHSR
jgi:hypothetical protein